MENFLFILKPKKYYAGSHDRLNQGKAYILPKRYLYWMAFLVAYRDKLLIYLNYKANHYNYKKGEELICRFHLINVLPKFARLKRLSSIDSQEWPTALVWRYDGSQMYNQKWK